MVVRNKICFVLCNLLILMAKSEIVDEKPSKKLGNLNLNVGSGGGGGREMETSSENFSWKNLNTDQNMFQDHEGVVTSRIRDELRFEPTSSNNRNLEMVGERRIRRQTGDDTEVESDFEEEGCVERGKWLALVSYMGLPMRIPCNPCESSYGVTWTKQSGGGNREIQFDDPYDDNRRVILGGDSAIYILRAELRDAGIYRCEAEEVLNSETDETVFSTIGTYRVEIKAPGEIHVIRQLEIGGNGDAEELGNTIKNGKLEMYTKWSKWSSCSECEHGRTHGERARMGYCYAMVQGDVYPLGLPCSSSKIPQSKRQVFRTRPDEKMIEACGGRCPDDSLERNLTLFARLLGKGRIQEEKVEGHEGAYIVLICPGLEMDSAVSWHNGTKVIDAEHLFESRGRINIDIYDGLQIFRVLKWDQQPYHCYVNGKRRATFRLYMTKEYVDPNEILESFIYIGILCGIYLIVFLIIMLAKHNVRRRSRVKKVHIPADI